ncbi:MAG: phosphoribosylaminoimidazolesuccinocarboxamide synthase [Chloroflexi bacterium]|nr:phosphoribosylaminoimidazolesuccinocarboxamide synthase [Chloroflexota bacterium]
MTSSASHAPHAPEPMHTTDLPLTKLHQGKVRDVYALPSTAAEGDRLLLVATDRISAFDQVLPNAIPRKGEVLTRTSAFWYDRTGDVVPNGFIAVLDAHNAAEYGVTDPRYFGRSMVMRRAEVLQVECVVRGYLTGSAWKDYQAAGRVSGITLPEGLRLAERLIDPLFTPSSKAEPPAHDAPMTYEEVEALVGVEVANAIKLRSLALYRFGAHLCGERGILVADTKFEFGMIDGEPCLVDEVLTPDCSRFWPADQYAPGRDQPSFDKQPLRDWIAANRDAQGAAPSLPPEVVEATSLRYQEAYRRITGEDLPPPAA